MEIEFDQLDLDDSLTIARLGGVLFDQYDEQNVLEPANDDCYENLYPHIA
jgi:hypothetical protein